MADAIMVPVDRLRYWHRALHWVNQLDGRMSGNSLVVTARDEIAALLPPELDPQEHARVGAMLSQARENVRPIVDRERALETASAADAGVDSARGGERG
jgi:hypothetical protein